MKGKILLAGLAVGLLLAGAVEAKGAKGDFVLALHYTAPESEESDVSLASGLSGKPIKLSITDGRKASDPAVIGESSDDDDKVWPVRTSNDLASWADEVLQKSASEWGVKTADNAPLTLSGELTSLKLVESNKAVGSTYRVELEVSFSLNDAKGKTLWSGTVPGDTTRYGKKRSADNANEVMRDALREAYTDLFNTPELQAAWAGNAKP
jgi:hypothetical protein